MKEDQKSNKFSILLRTVGALMFGLVIGDAAQAVLNDKPIDSAFERFLDFNIVIKRCRAL